MWAQEPSFHVYLPVLSLLPRLCPLHPGSILSPPTSSDAPPRPGPAQAWPRPMSGSTPPGPAPRLIPPHAWPCLASGLASTLPPPHVWPRPHPGPTLTDLGLWRFWSCAQARLQLPHHHLPLPLRDGSAALIPRGHQPVEVAQGHPVQLQRDQAVRGAPRRRLCPLCARRQVIGGGP